MLVSARAGTPFDFCPLLSKPCVFLARLSFIRRARDLGFTLEAVRELLALADDKNQSCEAVDALARVHLSQVDRKISDLKALRSELGRVIGSCSRGTVSDCRIIETLGPRSAEIGS